ncbi:MAG: hypothetical protein ABJA98_21675 [Acidobacteriota bacterium]
MTKPHTTARFRTFIGMAIGIACIGLVSIRAQGPQRSASTSRPYAVPRNALGQPDFEGVWTNNSITPLQRPAAWAGRTFLTDAEVALLQKTASKLEEGGDALFGDELVLDTLAGKQQSTSHDTETGNYNGFWLPSRDVDNRTSLIIDPADGRIPPETPAAQARRAALAEGRRLRPADGPESRGLSERCLTFGVPRFQAAYSSVYQIVQSPTHVVFRMETIHDARIIPIDGRQHVSDAIRQSNGDSRGHWEGDTLVVETKGFSPKTAFMGATDLHLVERFTRVSANTLQYDATMSDPTTWTRPWTARILFKRTDEPLLEYACHEGNIGLFGILSGARKQEADAARR